MTSLSEQLKRLSVPQTNALIITKSRPSLLFDLKEATNLDKDTFYCLGLNGLEGLELIDPQFKAYESILFSESSKFFQRSIQTESVNLKLDQDIEHFLHLLSPYVLTRAAQKTLEWLVYRFQIHLFNTNSLFMCVLPYHGSSLFVRVVQLFQIKDNSLFEFLKPIQSTGVPLGKMSVINYAIQNSGFLKLICNTTIEIIKELDTSNSEQYQTLLSFYATTVGGTIRYSKKVTEEMVTVILPFILHGLKSENDNLVISSLMIVNELNIKTQLSETLFSTLVKRISQQNTLEELDGLKCLISLYQYQKWHSLSDKPYMELLSMESLSDDLISLADQYDCKNFIYCLITKAINFAVSVNLESDKLKKILGKDLKKVKRKKLKKLFTASFRLIRKLFTEIIFEVDEIKSFTRQILNVYSNDLKNMKAKGRLKFVENVKQFIASVELRYTEHFEEIIESVLRKFSNKAKLSIQNVILGSLHIKDGKAEKDLSNTTLLLNLNHPSKARRIAAVNEFLKMHHLFKESDLEYIQSLLVSRLTEDSHEVIQQLILQPTILCEFLSANKLLSIFWKLLGRKWESDKIRNQIVSLIMKIVSGEDFIQALTSEEEVNEVIILLLPSLFPLSTKELSFIKILKESYLFKNVSIFNDHFQNAFYTIKDIHSDEALIILNYSTSELLIKFMIKHFKNDLFNTLEKLFQLSSSAGVQQHKYYFLVCIMMMSLIKKENSEAKRQDLLILALKIAQELLTIYDEVKAQETLTIFDDKSDEQVEDTKRMMYSDAENLMKHWLCVLKKQIFPYSVVILLLKNIIECTFLPLELSDLNRCWFAEFENNGKIRTWLSFHLQLFHLILGKSVPSSVHKFQKLVRLFLEKIMHDRTSLIKFLSMFWVQFEWHSSHNQSRFLESQVRSLNITFHLFNSCTKDEMSVINWEMVIPLLFMPLSSTHQSVRTFALECLSYIYQVNICNNPYHHLLEEIHNYKGQLELDNSILGQVFEIGIVKAGKARSKKKQTQTASKALINYLLNPSISDFLKANVLEITQSFSCEIVLLELQSLIDEQLTKLESNSLSVHEATMLRNLLRHFSSKSTPLFEKHSSMFKIFMRALNSSLILKGQNLSPQYLILNSITKEFFYALSSSFQQQIFSCLIEIKLVSTDTSILGLVSTIFKKISIDSSLFVMELEKLDQTCLMKSKTAVEEESSKVNNIVSTSSNDCQRGIIILEVLCVKKKLKSVNLLIPSLFQLLKTLLKSENQESLEYMKQLLLSSIHHCLGKLLNDKCSITSDVLSEKDVDIDAVVHCLRLSTDPETHRCALMLINLIAKIFHESVLHNIVNIFTFMGTSLLRQDDQYKFKLMVETLKAVIPIIFQTGSSDKKKNIEQLVIMILHVFVDAFNDIPNHRRIIIFKEILNLLNPSKFLWLVVALMIDYQVTHEAELKMIQGKQETKKIPDVMSTIVKFALELCLHYSPSVLLQTATYLLRYLSSLPKDKVEKIKHFTFNQNRHDVIKDSRGIFDVTNRSAKQLRYFKISIIVFVSSLLSSNSFIQKLSELNNEYKVLLKDLYRTALEESIHLIDKAVQWNDEYKLKSTSKFWRVFLHKAYDVLDKINILLPNEMFLEVILMLLSNKNPSVQSKALELLISRLQHQSHSFVEEEYDLLTLIIRELLPHLKLKRDTNAEMMDSKYIANIQNTLLSLKLISRLMGHHHLESLKEILTVVTDCFISNLNQPHICANSILTIVELCNCLQAHSIPFVHRFMPSFMKLLEDNKNLNSDELLFLSIIMGINKLVEILPYFLSPYLETIITQVCLMSVMDNSERKSLSSKIRLLQQNIAGCIPARILLPIIKSSFEKLTEHRLYLPTLMFLLNTSLSKLEKNDVSTHLPFLEAFFLQIINDCIEHEELFSSHVSQVLEAIVTFVMKMSEFSFRPFFYKFYTWAVHSEECKERLILFYSLANKLAEKLKSIFVLFAAPIMKNAVDILSDNNTLTEKFYFKATENDLVKNNELLKLLLDCLKRIFSYVNKDPVDEMHFENLIQPLVDQVENEIGTDDMYDERIKQFLCPCIRQFCVAVSNDALWKQLNYQLLLKTRNSSSQIRISSILILKEIFRQLQNDYLPLLPETIPFLAELMEDDSTQVEQECQVFITEIENDLGESLQKYF